MSNGQLGEILGELILGGEFGESSHSIEQGIYGLLSDYIGGVPIYRWRSQGSALPAITYELTRNDYQNELTQKSGVAEATFEFHIWSENYDDLADIGQQIRSVLDHFAGMARTRTVLTALHQNESDSIHQPGEGKARPIFCRTQEFTVLYLE